MEDFTFNLGNNINMDTFRCRRIDPDHLIVTPELNCEISQL